MYKGIDVIIEENDSMKRCSGCGSLKMETDFYFRNINQKIRKECMQCTKIKQRVYNSEVRKELKCILNKTKKTLLNIERIDKKQILIID